MHRHLSLPEVTRLAADLGYEYIELSPRPDFLWFFSYPTANTDTIRDFKAALRETGVQIASLLPLYRRASPVAEERRAVESSRFMRERIQQYVDMYWKAVYA